MAMSGPGLADMGYDYSVSGMDTRDGYYWWWRQHLIQKRITNSSVQYIHIHLYRYPYI